MEILNNFKEIVVEKPVDKIIGQIKELISSGQLKAGDRLPSERMLSEKFGVGRTYVRDAIRKLEFYGILKTLPQSGTVVSGMGITALEGLITDVLKLEGNDFRSLIETRVILETHCAALAAQRRTEADIAALEKALLAHKQKIDNEDYAVEEDFIFHLKIAEASKNSVLKSLMLIIIPDILYYFKKHDVCGNGRSNTAVELHEQILAHIKAQNVAEVQAAMREHMADILEFSRSIDTEPVANSRM